MTEETAKKTASNKAAPKKAAQQWVKAKLPNNKFGFYGTKRRYNGDEFTLIEGCPFSEKWMVKIDKPSGE